MKADKNNAKIDDNTKTIVYTPQEISALTVKEIEERRKTSGQGITFGLPEIDAKMLPFRPGELISVIGLTSQYKSGLMMFLARNAMKNLTDNQIVVYCTWEQAIEEHALMELANVTKIDASQIARGKIDDEQWGQLKAAAVKRSVSPLWLVGHSIQNRKKRPHLTIDDVGRGMVLIENEWGYRPALIVIDYLQRVESAAGGSDRRVEQMRIVDRCKDMALAMGCPVLLGAQAKQEVINRGWKLPGEYDAAETANVAHASDKILSVWLPHRTEPPRAMIGAPAVEVNENLLIINLAKQKFGPAPQYFYEHVIPERNEITQIARLP